MTRVHEMITAAFAVLALITSAGADTAFTYQGELRYNGAPANGLYNMDIALFDAPVGGNQLGAPVVIDGVAVADGTFAIELDFGASVFDNTGRWLEIEISGVTLSPRQPITRSPYSIQTRGIFVSDAGDVTIGDAANAAALTVNGPLVSAGPAGGTFQTVNPNNPTASFSLGWLNDVARLRIGGNGPGASGGLDIQRVGDASLLRILHNGNVGIGTTNPIADLHVVGDGINTAMRLTNGGQSNTGLVIADVGGSSRAASLYGVTSAELVRVQNDGSGPAAKVVGDVELIGGGLTLAVDSIRVPGAGTNSDGPVFIHVASESNSTACDNGGCFCYTTQINHPLCNGDPNAILFVTVNGQVASSQPVVQSVKYSVGASRWYIECMFNQWFCEGQKFNVLVVKP